MVGTSECGNEPSGSMNNEPSGSMKCGEISRLAENRLASQEGLCSMK